jgi:hypothetical protein
MKYPRRSPLSWQQTLISTSCIDSWSRGHCDLMMMMMIVIADDDVWSLLGRMNGGRRILTSKRWMRIGSVVVIVMLRSLYKDFNWVK